MYFHKYIKYSNKHLEFIGGAGGGGEAAVVKKFRLITTGFADNGIRSAWVVLRKHFLSLIPEQYTQIEIIHTDPIGLPSEAENEAKLAEMNAQLEEGDKSIPRVVSSISTREYLTRFVEEQGNDYLVLDCAHIFGYLPDGTVQCSGHYADEPYSETNKNKIFNYKCIYVGYTGIYNWSGSPNVDPDPENVTTLNDGIFLYRHLMSHCKLFEVKSDGKVFTYIDRLLELGIPLFKFGSEINTQHPGETFWEIYKQISKFGRDKARVLPESGNTGIKWIKLVNENPIEAKYLVELMFTEVLSGKPIETICDELSTHMLKKVGLIT
jgi:hypothetical protein